MQFLTELIHWAALLAALLVAFRLFRDLSPPGRRLLPTGDEVRAQTRTGRRHLSAISTALWGISLGVLALFEGGQGIAFVALSLLLAAMMAGGLAGGAGRHGEP